MATPATGEPRPEELRARYELEVRLADRLRHSTRDERRYLYGALYGELYREVPALRDAGRTARAREHNLAVVWPLVRGFIWPASRCLEVGAGDCAMALQMAGSAASVCAVDVTQEGVDRVGWPANLRMVVGDGITLPIGSETQDLVLSSQVLEHLHPDDVADHLCDVRRVLVPGGLFLCITPNRLFGPSDVSRHFSAVPTGLHLREYTYGEVRDLLKAAGFRGSRYLTRPLAGRMWALPEGVFVGLERVLHAASAGRPVWRWRVFRGLLGVRIVARR